MANTANNSTIIMKKKTTQGRKKIEIKKIANISNRQVTFSKRRGGLFKKASELCILTGAEVAIIVHSLGKRIFAFGHPNVDSVIDRYTTGSSASSSLVSKPTQLSAAKIHEHNLQYAKLCKELEAEKKKNEILEGAKLVNNVNNFWWDEPVDHLGLEELEQYMNALEELRKTVLMRADELALLKNPPLPFNNVHMNNMTSTVGCDDLISNPMSNQHSTAIIPSDGLGNQQI